MSWCRENSSSCWYSLPIWDKNVLLIFIIDKKNIEMYYPNELKFRLLFNNLEGYIAISQGLVACTAWLSEIKGLKADDE